MDLQLLQEFLCLAEHLNFSEAAKRLYVAQSALSRHIAELEKQLGAQLFIRTKHSVQLTVVGQLWAQEATALLAHYEQAVKRVHLAASGCTGQLRIGYLSGVVKKFFPALISQFHIHYPNIDLNFSQLRLGEIPDQLMHADIDIGFTLSAELPQHSGLSWQKLYSDKITVVLRYDHPLAHKNLLALSDLAQEPFIFLMRRDSPGYFDYLLDICLARGFSPNIIKQPPMLETVLLLVETGIGITLLPHYLDAYSTPKLRFIDIEGLDTRIDVGVCHKTTNTNPLIQSFLNEVSCYFADHRHLE